MMRVNWNREMRILSAEGDEAVPEEEQHGHVELAAGSLQQRASMPPLAQMTIGLRELYAQCRFREGRSHAAPQSSLTAAIQALPSTMGAGDWSPVPAPTRMLPARDPSPKSQRILTRKSQRKINGGLDNEDHNLIVRVSDVLGGNEALPPQPEYVVLDMLGQGTFGQVFRCQNKESNEIVAIKIVRNHPSYFKQATTEAQITALLNAAFTSEDAPHIIRLKDKFEFRSHVCLIFEVLSMNLYEFISENSFNGFPLEVTRGLVQQVLHALVQLEGKGVIHCDLKPENILLVGRNRSLSDVNYPVPLSYGANPATHGAMTDRTPHIKVVDFGSACMESETVFSYIQSRFYRSPEVLLGIPYNAAIDLWSLGCIAVELFLGLPLFPGTTEHDQLVRIQDALGSLPQHLLRRGRNVLKFYNICGNEFVLKTPAEFASETKTKLCPSKRYFQHSKLKDMVIAHPQTNDLPNSDLLFANERRHAFVHFLEGLLCVDPDARWSAWDAMQHPFVTGERFHPEVFEYRRRLPAVTRRFSTQGSAAVSHGTQLATADTTCNIQCVSKSEEESRHINWPISSTMAPCDDTATWGHSGWHPYAPAYYNAAILPIQLERNIPRDGVSSDVAFSYTEHPYMLKNGFVGNDSEQLSLQMKAQPVTSTAPVQNTMANSKVIPVTSGLGFGCSPVPFSTNFDHGDRIPQLPSCEYDHTNRNGWRWDSWQYAESQGGGVWTQSAASSIWLPDRVCPRPEIRQRPSAHHEMELLHGPIRRTTRHAAWFTGFSKSYWTRGSPRTTSIGPIPPWHEPNNSRIHRHRGHNNGPPHEITRRVDHRGNSTSRHTRVRRSPKNALSKASNRLDHERVSSAHSGPVRIDPSESHTTPAIALLPRHILSQD